MNETASATTVELNVESRRPAASKHSSEIDTLRAVAIFSVLASHFLPPESVFNRIQQGLQQGPTFGVPLFFALSGFLITRILVQSREMIDRRSTTSKHSLYIFYARRFLRIFPLYYAVLFLGTLLKYPNVRKALFWHVAYLSNFYYMHRGAFDKGPAPVFWTLSVEEQFYLLWPLLFLLAPTRWLPKLTLMIACAGCAFAGWASSRGPVFNTLMPVQLVYLALGGYLGLAGVAPFGNANSLRRAMKYFVCAACICTLGYWVIYLTLSTPAVRLRIQNGFRYAASAFVFAWIVARLSRGVGGYPGRVLRWPVLTFIGRISYGIYILQFFVTQMMDRALPLVANHVGAIPASWLLQSFAARFIVICIVAAVSYFAFESPINNLKRYFPYGNGAEAATPLRRTS